MNNLGQAGTRVITYYDRSGSWVSGPSVNPLGGMPFAEKRLALCNSMWAAKMSWSSSWNKLAITVRFCVEDPGVGRRGTNFTNGASPAFYCGVMATPSASMTNGVLSPSSSHFVGIKTTEGNWTRNGTDTWMVMDLGGNITSYAFLARTGSNERIDYMGANWAPGRTIGTESIPSIFTLLLTKGVNFYSMSVVYNGGMGGVKYGVHRAAQTYHIQQLAAINTNLVDNYIESFSPNTNYIDYDAVGYIPVDEVAHGALDSICLAYNRSWPRIYVSEILWTRLIL
jgi:hypothetical protein